MSEFINTVDVVDGETLIDSIIEKTITEYKDNKITAVRDGVFYGCKSLTDVDLPNVTNARGTTDVYSQYEGVFAECSSLVKVNIPLLEWIGGYYYPGFFQSCISIEKLDFLNAKHVGRQAFSGCSSLRCLVLRKSDGICSLANANAFTNTPIASGTGYIYVPRALLSDTDATKDYRRATNWSTYADQFRAIEDYSVDGTLAGEIDPSKHGVTSPILDGLVEYFDPGDESQWDGYTISSKINSGKTGRFIQGGKGQFVKETTLPETYKGNMVGGGVVFMSTLSDYGITDAFTLEFVLDMVSSQSFFMLLQSPIDLWNGSTVLLSRNNNMGGLVQYYNNTMHFTVVVTEDSTKYYFNGSYVGTGTTLTAEQIAAGVAIASGYGDKTSGIGGIRLYNRALTADEVRNNFLYASTIFDLGENYF